MQRFISAKTQGWEFDEKDAVDCWVEEFEEGLAKEQHRLRQRARRGGADGGSETESTPASASEE